MKSYLQRLCAAILSITLLSTGMNTKAFGISAVQQWNLSDEGYGIGVQAAWDRGVNGDGVRLALIDSGINRAHEDLQGVAIEQGYNVIEQNTDTIDNFGHGTVVAGIIAANSRNDIGINGICDGVTIVPIKCFDSSVSDVRHVVTGIYMAVDDFRCDVINLSLGVSSDDPALREAVDYAVSKNVIIISAVGNNGSTTPGQILYPSGYSNVVGVGAYGRDGEVCDFSHVNSSVFVTAPGTDLYSLDAKSENGYYIVSGTSFAAAQVSALAVLAKSWDKDMTVTQFQELLKSSATDAGPAGYDTAYGYGRISIPGLLQAMDDLPAYQDIASHWARENILYCTDRGLLSGTGNRQFSPDAPLTRAMVVSILWRLDGAPVSTGNPVFTDVHSQDWFSNGIYWAAEHKIISGYPDGSFRPDEPVTREQLSSIFYRYAAYCSIAQTAEISAVYSDWSEISPYAEEAFSWAIANGIIHGKTDTTIVPQGRATRAEAATILRNFLTVYNL